VRNRKEECIAFDLHQPQGGGGVEHRLEQTLGYLLRVREVQAVKPHELRVAGDVCEKK
jgi:hypothetical protein